MSTNRISANAGWVNPKRLERGPGGRALCRECNKEVGKGRRSFCSDLCVDRWKIKTDPNHVRLLLFRRDRGVCAVCKVDTCEQDRKRLSLPWRERYDYLESIRATGRITLWDADHIVEVINGGGECSLTNYQTLCIACHKDKTAQLARNRAAAKRAEKLVEKESAA